MGRASMYSDELGQRICELVAQRVPVAEICAMEGMPSKDTLYRWKRENLAFSDNYARAREERADARQDYIDELAAKVLSGALDPAAARVLIDAEKWQMGKEKPKTYGERSFQDVNTTVVTINVAFEDYIRSLNEGATVQKVIDGTLATEAGRVENLSAAVRQGSVEGNS
jgi:hypothetical protein